MASPKSCVVFVAMLMLASLHLTLANAWIENSDATASGHWRSVAVSSDGSKQVAIDDFRIYFSDDGIKWTMDSYDPGLTLTGVAISSDGAVITVVSTDGAFTRENTTPEGYIWSKTIDDDLFSSTFSLKGVAMDSSGKYETALDQRGFILMAKHSPFYRNNAFATLQGFDTDTWNENPDADYLTDVDMSFTGEKQTVVGEKSDGTGGIAVTTNNTGVTWVRASEPFGLLQSVCMSADGTHQVAVGYDEVWMSTNSGESWIKNSLDLSMVDCSITGDGGKVVLVGEPEICSSTDFGVSWTIETTASDQIFSFISMSWSGDVATAGRYLNSSSTPLWNKNKEVPPPPPIEPIPCSSIDDCPFPPGECKPRAVRRRRRLFGTFSPPSDYCHYPDGTLMSSSDFDSDGDLDDDLGPPPSDDEYYGDDYSLDDGR